MSLFSRTYGNLDILDTYGPPRPVTRLALPFIPAWNKQASDTLRNLVSPFLSSQSAIIYIKSSLNGRLLKVLTFVLRHRVEEDTVIMY
jgi:hypothetical protein